MNMKIKIRCFNPVQDGLFRGCSRMGGTLPKICHTYPTMMKFGTVIPYPKKIQKLNKSHPLRSADIKFLYRK